jgi:hypothetical protein
MYNCLGTPAAADEFQTVIDAGNLAVCKSETPKRADIRKGVVLAPPKHPNPVDYFHGSARTRKNVQGDKKAARENQAI